MPVTFSGQPMYPKSYRGYNELHKVSVYRSQAWIERLMPDYEQGHQHFFEHCAEAWKNRNPKAIQIAYEVANSLGIQAPEWAKAGFNDLVLMMVQDTKSLVSIGEELDDRFRGLEHFNALNRAREEGHKSDEAYERASELLGKRDNEKYGLSQSTFDKALKPIKVALIDPVLRGTYFVVEVPTQTVLHKWRLKL